MGKMRRVGWVLLWVGLLVGLVLGMPDRALASVHTYPEGGERVLVRSLQTVRDRSDQAWQLVLFKRLEAGQTTSIHLRLVGFPGAVEFRHPAALQVGATGHEWLAADLLGDYPANVGEYDVWEPMSHLMSNAPLQLVLPTQTPTVMVVPPFVVKEWRQVTALPAAAASEPGSPQV